MALLSMSKRTPAIHNIGRTMKKPKDVIILGIKYDILYFDNPAEVDRSKRTALWGQTDFWSRTIRIYDNGKPLEEIWQTILHEVIHGIASTLHIDDKVGDEDNLVDLLATGIIDTFIRNKWILLEE